MVLELLLFSLALSIDSFSAAIALGFRHFSTRRALFFASSSGFSEGLATAIGFLLGHIARNLITQYDHWIAFILLFSVGIHMCYQAYLEIKFNHTVDDEIKVHGPLKILFVSSITSIDSLGVGVSLGLVNKPIIPYSLFIGIGAFLSTYLGLFLAKKISNKLGSKVEFIGGLVLIVLGIKMLSI
ncbi:MAG: manganese efflux pump [Thermosynechococcaceae cyanobacterium]